MGQAVPHADRRPLDIDNSPGRISPQNALRYDCAAPAVSKAPGFHGKTPLDVVSDIGDPVLKESFKIGDRRDGFRIELRTPYPLENPGNAEVEVQEWSWKYEGYNLTLWFHAPKGEWSVFAGLLWPDGVDFGLSAQSSRHCSSAA
jgi:hypothetical protein